MVCNNSGSFALYPTPGTEGHYGRAWKDSTLFYVLSFKSLIISCNTSIIIIIIIIIMLTTQLDSTLTLTYKHS